jgi:hypothetical protein
MSEFNIEVQGGSSVRLPTAGKYCEKDIIVTASGGGGTEEIENIIDASGVLDSTDGTVTDKVEQLIDKAEVEKWLFDNSVFGDETRRISLANIPTITYVPKTKAFSKLVTASNLLSGCSNLVSVNGLDIRSANVAKSAFQKDSVLETVVLENTVNVTDFYRAFYWCENLKTLKTLNMSSVTNAADMFFGCSKLETLLFVPETIKISITIPSPALSKESISGEQGIINGLNSEVTGQTLTIPRNAVKKAFETSEGANDGDTSETWNALVASKPNWTISLS